MPDTMTSTELKIERVEELTKRKALLLARVRSAALEVQEINPELEQLRAELIEELGMPGEYIDVLDQATVRTLERGL